MTGKERVLATLTGQPVRRWTDRLPCLPILHSGLPPLFGVTSRDYHTSAATMADVMIRGCRTLGLDGVQLSLGVTGEAEALGAAVEIPDEGAPILREILLGDLSDPRGLEVLRARAARHDPAAAGRMPLYFEAVARTVAAIGETAYVLAMLRGPLLAASQLCGVEPLLIALLTEPDAVARVLDFTTELATRLGTWLLGSGAHGLILGEATCSPNFISPRLYRELVQPRHRILVAALEAAGWETVGLHICGNVAPIFEDVVATGVTWVDIDHQVPVTRALELARGRVVLRGNLDPSAVFRFGSPAQVRAATAALRRELDAAGTETGPQRWIAGSGCDIPPGTPEANLRAFVSGLQ